MNRPPPSVLDFNQTVAVKLGLDCQDLVFLAWFVRWVQKRNMRRRESEDGTVCYWLNYPTVLAQLPMLRITDKSALSRRLHRLVDAGVLVGTVEKVAGGGSRTFYGFGGEWEYLTDTPDDSSATSRDDSSATSDVAEEPPPTSDPNETSGPKTSAVASAPAREVPPTRRFSDLFYARDKHKWAVGGREGKSLATLVKWAKDEQPARWEEYLLLFMDGAWALKQGELVGMTAFDKHRWATLAYTPSGLLGAHGNIMAALENIQHKPIDADEYARAALAAVK